MKAVVTDGLGGPEVLSIRDIPKPAIKSPRDILVRLKAAGVNPVDAKLRKRGNYFPDLSPAVPGCDAARRASPSRRVAKGTHQSFSALCFSR